MKKSLIAILVAVSLLLAACTAAESTLGSSTPTSVGVSGTPNTHATDPTQTSQPTQPKQTEPTVQEEPPLNPAFSDMPEMFSDYAEVYLMEHIAIFTFLMSGMNDTNLLIMTYDMVTDTLLGQLNLGEGYFSVFPLEADRFAVLDLNRAVYRVYDSSCHLVNETTISGVQAPLGIAGMHENVLLVS